MDCPPKIENDSYNFLDNVDEYVQASEKINSVNLEPKDNNDCANFSNQHAKSFTEIGKNICEQFLKLYKSLPNIKNYIVDGTCYNKDCGFLNYWLNFELKKNNKKICVKDFYNAIESYCEDTIDKHLPVGVIYNIDKDQLNKIDKLYSLYSEYTKLNTIIQSLQENDKQKLLTLSTQCCTDYSDVSYICNDDNKINNHKFCEKLTDFERKYKDLYPKVDDKGSDFKEYFMKLEKCPNNKIITSSVIGSVVGIIPLFGVLYKFTPMGQVLRSKMGILNNDISNNAEETINVSLMEQENEPLKFRQGTYNIKYQSL
ncbi:unnamed protein product [Plasmodium vivax]|uniref:(malaria parasite P. vivax) hypothetical protein n=1 Tax=Plasmodium vivax TaxID=5855 RepID=A0A8S4HLD3_PLAVI|nr:unnamed protein product [Plasmodium vivax]